MTMLAPALEGAAKQGCVEANGQLLAWEQFGDDTAPAIVLIAGLGAQLLAWPDALCQALAGAGLRVIRYDNRDVGLSSKFDTALVHDRPRRAMLRRMLRQRIDTPYTLMDMADDALGLLDGLAIGRAHVVGASMGGMIAQLLAGRQPQRILSLASLMSSSGARRLPRGKWRVLRQMSSRPRRADEDTVVAHASRTMQLLGGPLGPGPDAWEAEARRAFRRSYYPPGVARHMLAVLAAPSRVDLLHTIRQPALVIHGGADPLLPVKHGRDTARHLPTARYEEIAGMGHCLPPSRLADCVDMLVDNAGAAA